MRLGVILPSFAPDAVAARRAALECERAGIHGVFCFDHLWPLGEPGRPAISPHPLLGAIAQETTTIKIGTLVSRVGIVPDRVLISELFTLHRLSNGRFIASLGTGDYKSAAENRAFGLDFTRAAIRRHELFSVASSLREREVTVWIGGGSSATNKEALLSGASLNLWAEPVASVRTAAVKGSVSWAGRFPSDHEDAGKKLAELRDAGATWAVYIWPESIEAIVQAAIEGGVDLGNC